MRAGRCRTKSVDARAAGVVLALLGAACEELDVGRGEDPLAPPRLVHLIVEELCGYHLIDLLQRESPAPCGPSAPCPAAPLGLAPQCIEGSCVGGHHAGVPVPVGALGLFQVRAVFSKRLAPETETIVSSDGGTVFQLAEAAIAIGREGGPGQAAVPVAIAGAYYYPSGAPEETLDPVGDPLGPALVAPIGEELVADARYRVTLAPAAVRDARGQPLAEDRDGPLPPGGYSFVTEGFRVIASVPTPPVVDSDGMPPDPPPAAIDPAAVVQLFTNLPLDGPLGVAVTDQGAPVKVVAWLDRGHDPALCAAGDPFHINVVRVDETGQPADWVAGATYRLHVEGAANACAGAARLAPFDLVFAAIAGRIVEAGGGGPTRDGVVFPEQCR